MWQLKHHVNRNTFILGNNMPGILCLCHQEFQPLQGSWNTVYKTKFSFWVIQFPQWKASWHSILGESSAVSEWKIFWNFYFWKTNCCRKWPWHTQVNYEKMVNSQFKDQVILCCVVYHQTSHKIAQHGWFFSNPKKCCKSLFYSSLTLLESSKSKILTSLWTEPHMTSMQSVLKVNKVLPLLDQLSQIF